jgi:hypothetical protein
MKIAGGMACGVGRPREHREFNSDVTAPGGQASLHGNYPIGGDSSAR